MRNLRQTLLVLVHEKLGPELEVRVDLLEGLGVVAVELDALPKVLRGVRFTFANVGEERMSARVVGMEAMESEARARQASEGAASSNGKACAEIEAKGMPERDPNEDSAKEAPLSFCHLSTCTCGRRFLRAHADGLG